MSGEYLFELIEKAQWSFERKLRRKDNNQSWTLTNNLKKWFNSSIKLSPNAEQFLQQTGETFTPISLHLASDRLALVINNNICIISLNTSQVLIEIPLDLLRSDEYNYLNCLTWSNNGKLLAYGHWSGIVCVYSSNDGQLLHELPTKSFNRNEDSFVEIWFSGSDASQFIDLLCLKRTGNLIRYVMSRDDIASCAEETFEFSITCARIDSNQNQIYLVPFREKSIFVCKILDTKPSIMKIKQMIDDEINEIYITNLAISPDQLYLVALMSNQSIVLYENNDYFRCLAIVQISAKRTMICDLDYWDDKTLLVFYSDGSIGFHEGKETLEEYRYESNQFHPYPHLCRRISDNLFLINSQIQMNSIENLDEDHSNIFTRLFRSFQDSIQSNITQHLILIEHTDPDRLIESLISTGDYGEALRVCKVFHRTDLSDRIHEIEVRTSSTQIQTRLIRIQSRLHVMQLCTTIFYSTFDEQLQLIQFGLDYATRQEYFKKLFLSEEIFHQSIYDEKSSLEEFVDEKSSIQLNYSQKQVLFYRKKILEQKRKLYLYEDFIHKCKIFRTYQEKIFEKFQSWDYKQIAIRCAREGHINGLKLVLERAIPAVSSNDLLLILSEIPENISLNEYEELIPKYEMKISERKENDWSSKYIISIDDESSNQSNRDVYIQWYQERILSFESFGFIENAYQLSKYALETEQFNEFILLNRNLSFEYFLNKIPELDLTLKQIEQMSESNIMNFILTFKSDDNQDDIDKRIQQILLPIHQLFHQLKQSIEENLIEKFEQNFNIYFILRSLKFKTIFQTNEFEQLIRNLILNIHSIDQISIIKKCLTLINEKQDLEYLIESCRIFHKWSVRMIPFEMNRIIQSEESLSNAIVLLIQSAIREERTKMTIATGDELYHDIEQIAGHYLPSETLSNLFVSSLLKSDRIECFQIVRSYVSRLPIPLIIQAANEYIDSSKTGDDKSIRLAEQCLELIHDQSLVTNELNLIKSQKICDFFQYSITPLEIRRHPNPMQIIPAILNSKPQAYKNRGKLISLASHLENGDEHRCMLYIAEYCLKINDLKTCGELCSILIELDYGHAWKCAWNLIERSSGEISRTMLAFISRYCDEILLDQVLKKSRDCRDQSIPKDEYDSVSTNSFYTNPFYDRTYSKKNQFGDLPLLKSPPIDEKSAIKYVNIDTPLFIMIYLSSNTQNDILIKKDNEYALQLSIYCQSLKHCSSPRNLLAVPTSLVDKNFLEKNETYNRLIEDRQYAKLNQLDSSIDLTRFKIDDEYRRLTILGLFMIDEPIRDYAEQLAIKYNISIDECHHTYIEYLLTNSSLLLNDIRKKLRPFLTNERMKKNRQIKLDLVKRLHTNVFPLISGYDYERLKLFYDIKKTLGDHTHAQKHIQAIQQLITILEGDFDYKLFLSSPEIFIEKYANDTNIIKLGLVLDQIKINSNKIISSSWIYAYYLHTNLTSVLIFDLLNRIDLFEEFSWILNHLLSSRDQLLIDQRIKILEFTLNLIQTKDDEQWKTIEEFLKRNLLRLEILSKLLTNYSQEELNQLDQCQTIDQQEEFLAKCLYKYQQFNSIIYLKTHLFNQISIQQILKLTIENLRSNEVDYLDKLFENLSFDKIDQKELFNCLQRLCRSEQIDRKIRFKIIDKLDKMFDKQGLQSDDLLLFEQYRLANLLSSFDSFTEIKNDEIESNEKRRDLFENYLSQAQKMIHFESLIQILNNLWSNEQMNSMKGSHGLTLKNELLLSMVEKDFDWERILRENIIVVDQQEITALIEYLYNSTNLKSYAYLFWLINPVDSLADLLFRSPSKSIIDEKFLRLSIEKARINDILSINPTLFDYYIQINLTNDEQLSIIHQLETNEEFLFKLGQFFLHKENYSSSISFGLIVDILQKYFLK